MSSNVVYLPITAVSRPSNPGPEGHRMFYFEVEMERVDKMPILTLAEEILRPFPFFSTIVSGLILAFLVWIVAIAKNYMKLRNSSQIDIEYWRLFGPSTTRIMELLDHDPKVVSQDNYLSHTQFQMPDGIDMVEKDFWRAYCSIVAKRKFITARKWLWEKYSGKRDEGRRLDFLAKPPTDYEVNAWIDDNYVDQSGDIEIEYVDTSDRNLGWQPAENDVGFLFMNLKNSSTFSLTNVLVTFQKANLAERLPKIDTPYRWPYKEIKAQFELKGHPDNYLIKDNFEFGETVSFKMSKWEAGLEISFLLSVYRSDDDGFENGYLDDVYKLKSIESKYFGRVKSFGVREPLREASLREKIPYGWLRQ